MNCYRCGVLLVSSALAACGWYAVLTWNRFLSLRKKELYCEYTRLAMRGLEIYLTRLQQERSTCSSPLRRRTGSIAGRRE